MRTYAQIARDIEREWKLSSKPGIYFGAKPYLDALKQMDTTNPDELYICERVSDIADYFLANASNFRGQRARELKKELQQMCIAGN